MRIKEQLDKKSDSEDNEIEADVILNINNMQEFERQLNEGSAKKPNNHIS